MCPRMHGDRSPTGYSPFVDTGTLLHYTPPTMRGMAGGDDITVRVEWLARRLRQQEEDAAATEHHRIMVNTHRVSRVPGHVRLANPDAYTPGLVSIGPLHAKDGERRLRAGNRLKMSYLNSLLSRGHPDASGHLAVIQGYVRLVAAREREARAMYAAEDVDDVTAEDLVQMLVLDGCFIIEHLVNVVNSVEEPSLHEIPFGPAQLSVDLILAENQIPFFVLVDLIGGTKLPQFENTGYDPPVLLVKLVLSYLAGDKGRDMSDALPPAEGVCHVLHLLHEAVRAARTRWEPPPRVIQDAAALETMQEAARQLRRLPLLLLVPLLYPILPEERKWRASYGREDLPSAVDLKRMWVRFKKARGGGGAGGKAAAPGIVSVLGPVPLAVKMAHEDLLRLPQLRIEFRTAPLLLNLMAFERAAEHQRAGDVSAYVWLMAKLAQSAEDAGVLVAAEVVQLQSGGASAGGGSKEDVARFFRQVGAASEAAEELERSYLGETLQKLRERSQHPLFMMWADVQRNYFTVPWAVVAEFVAFITFISTILQTYGSFKH